MKKVLFSLCMASALMGLSSCGSSKGAATVADISGEWDIIEINGTAVVPVPGQDFPFIGFDTQGGKVYGNSGCNRILGSFDIHAKPGTIDLGALGSTRMMCSDMTVEQNVLSALATVKKYKVMKKGQVALCGSSKRPVLVLQRRDVSVNPADLNGKWIIEQAGGEAIPTGLETQPFMEFNMAEKRMHGHAGCNLINGGVVIDTAHPTAISFPQVASTMMACPDSSVETRVLKALGEVKSFGKLAGGHIGLYNAGGELVLVLVKA